jgi:glycine/D-amino acid oxidase-like deaminating enzyme
MTIAVIGKGISGLACAYFLKKRGLHVEVFFDQPGASHAASGLVHPYPGDKGEKAFCADQAYEDAKQLFFELQDVNDKFAFEEGFFRKPTSLLMKQNLENAGVDEIEKVNEDLFFIKKGIRLDTLKYLKRLEEVCLQMGVVFHQTKIHSLSDLSHFDKLFVCAGYGIKDLQQDLKLKYLKGQSFVFNKMCQHEKGFLTKGYLVPYSNKVIIGSTYERKFESIGPDFNAAFKIMNDNIQAYFKDYGDIKPVEIHAGVRVAHPNFNMPKWFIKDEKVVFLTGLGSRGLLYHATWAKMAAWYYNDLKKMPDFFWHEWTKSNVQNGISCKDKKRV